MTCVAGAAFTSADRLRAKLPTPGDWTKTQGLPSFLQASLKDKTFAFGTAVPFGMNARQMDAWIIGGGGQELLDEFYNAYNVYSFLGGNTGV